MYSSSTGIGKMKLSKLKEGKEDEILTNFDRDLLESATSITAVHERAVKAHKHYTAHVTKAASSIYATDSYDAQFFGSLAAAVSSEFQLLTSSPYLLGYEARSEEGDSLADFYDAAFDYHWREDPRRMRKLNKMLLQRRLYGSSYGKLCWNEEYRLEGFMKAEETMIDVPMRNPFDGLPSVVQAPMKTQKWVTERRKKKDSPWLEVFDFLSCFPDTKQEYVQDGRFFIHRTRRTRQYVEEQGKKGTWYRAVARELLEEPGSGMTNGQYTTEYIEALNATVGFSMNEYNYNASNGIYEEFEYWTPAGYAVICNRRVVAFYRGHLLGYYPLIQVRNYLVPGEHFGMSDYQVVEKSVGDFQNMHNTMLSNAYANAFPPIVVGAGVDLKEFRQAYRPGGIMRVPGQDLNSSIRQLPVSTDSIQMAQQIKESLRSSMDNTLATSDTARGALPSRSTSATAVVQAQNSLSARQGMQAAMFETEFLQPLGEGFRDLVTKLQSDDISIKLRGGKDWVKWRPMLDGYDPDLDCVAVAGSNKLSELEQKRLIELLNLAANFRIPNVNLQEGFRVVAESMAPRLASRLIMDDAAYKSMVVEQAMLARLTEGPPGPGGGMDGAGPGGGPGAMAVSNQIGNSAMDKQTDEMSQEMGTEQQL